MGWDCLLEEEEGEVRGRRLWERGSRSRGRMGLWLLLPFLVLFFFVYIYIYKRDPRMSVTTKIEPKWFPNTATLKIRAVVVKDEDSMKMFLRVR